MVTTVMMVHVIIYILRLPSVVLFVTLRGVYMLYFGTMLSQLTLVLSASMSFDFHLITVCSDR